MSLYRWRNLSIDNADYELLVFGEGLAERLPVVGVDLVNIADHGLRITASILQVYLIFRVLGNVDCRGLPLCNTRHTLYHDPATSCGQ